MPQAFKPLSVCFDGPFWIYKSTYEYRPADRSFRHTPRVSLITLPRLWTGKWEIRGKLLQMHSWYVMNLSQFISSLTVTFVSFNERSRQYNKKPAVDCVLCIVWMSMNVVSSVHFQMSSFIQSANINIERKQIFDRYLSPKSYHHYSFSLWSLDYCKSNHNNKIDWINRQ